jgi:hypothetical protein
VLRLRCVCALFAHLFALRLRCDCVVSAMRLCCVCAAIALCLRCFCAAIAPCLCCVWLRLRCECAAFALQMRRVCAPFAQHLCCVCAAISLRLRCVCVAFALRLSSVCAAYVLRLRCVCAPFEFRSRRVCAAFVLRLRSDSTAIPMRLRCFFAACTQSFRSICIILCSILHIGRAVFAHLRLHSFCVRSAFVLLLLRFYSALNSCTAVRLICVCDASARLASPLRSRHVCFSFARFRTFSLSHLCAFRLFVLHHRNFMFVLYAPLTHSPTLPRFSSATRAMWADSASF